MLKSVSGYLSRVASQVRGPLLGRPVSPKVPPAWSGYREYPGDLAGRSEMRSSVGGFQSQPVKPEKTRELEDSVARILKPIDFEDGADRLLWRSPDSKAYISISFKAPSEGNIVVYHRDLPAQIGTIEFDGTGKVTSIQRYGIDYCGVSPVDAAAAYASYENMPLADTLPAALKLPSLSSTTVEQFRAKLANKERELASIKPVKTRERRCTELADDTVVIGQNAFCIVRAESARSGSIATYVGPCVALALVDRSGREAALAHFDASTSELAGDSVDAVLSAMSSRDVTCFEGHLVGGVVGESEELILALRRALVDRCIKIVEEDLLQGEGTAVVLDARTGELADFDPRSMPAHTANGLPLAGRLERVYF